MEIRNILAYFSDEDKAGKAISTLRERGVVIKNVHAPYYVHKFDELLSIKRTRLLVIGFAAGLTGLILAVAMQIWTSAYDWPLIVGGKPFNSFPAFIPVTFELTVLFSGVIGIGALMLRNKMFPLAKRDIYSGVTCDKFVVVIEQRDESIDSKEIISLLNKLNVEAIEEI